MIHTAFIAHLEGAGLAAPVKNAFTTEPVENYDEDFPVVMVFPNSETFGESGYDNVTIQEQVAEVICMVGCELTDIEDRVRELRAAAVGWKHPNANGQEWDAMEAGGGELIGLSGKYIWWRETFTARTQFRQT